MEKFLLYNLEVSVVLLVLTLFYNILLRNQKYFEINRSYLQFSIIFAFVIPLLNFRSPAEIPAAVSEISRSFTASITVTAGDQGSFPGIWEIAAYLYFAGMAVTALFLTVKILKLTAVLGKYEYTCKNCYYLAFDNDSSESFSFLNRIVIGTKGHDEAEIKMMLEHEKIHVRKVHSLDVLIVELAAVIQWFNPAVYILRRNMLNNHEFTADRKIKQGIRTRDYINLVTKKVIGAPLLPVNSFFNKSLLKRRLIMLTDTKIRKTGIISYLLAFPLLLMIFFTVSCSDSGTEFYPEAYMEADFQNAISQDNQPAEFEGNLSSYINSNITQPKKAAAEDAMGRLQYRILIGKDGSVEDFQFVNSKFVEDAHKKYLGDYKDIAADIIEKMPAWKPAMKDGKPVEMKKLLAFIFGDRERWNKVNPTDKITNNERGSESTVERTKDMEGVKHVYFKDLMTQISKNIKYPEKMKSDGVEGRVILDLKLDKQGIIVEVKPIATTFQKDGKDIESEDKYGMTEEAVRVVKSISGLPPAEDKEGNPVAVSVKLPIKFKLK